MYYLWRYRIGREAACLMNVAEIMSGCSAAWLSVTTFSAIYINNLVLNRIAAAHLVTAHIDMLVTRRIIRLREPFHYKPHKLLVTPE